MLVRTFASAVTGIDAVTVTIEVNESRGIQFFLVGLPDSAVKESQHRIASAFSSLNHHWPGKQIVINMAPADIRKEGSAYDLPLAVGILAADEKVVERRDRIICADGRIISRWYPSTGKRSSSYSSSGQGGRVQRGYCSGKKCTGSCSCR